MRNRAGGGRSRTGFHVAWWGMALSTVALCLVGWTCAAHRSSEDLGITPQPAVVDVSSAADSVPVVFSALDDLAPDQAVSAGGRLAPTLDSLRGRVSRAETAGGGAGPVRMRVADSAPGLPASAERALREPEGYVLAVQGRDATVVGGDSLGLLHGMVTLAKLAESRGGQLPSGVIADWPALRIRAVHFVARGVDEASARRIIDMARDHQFNTLIVQLGDGVALPSMSKIARADAWSPEAFRRIAAYARANGLEFVPELKLLTHQEKLFKKAYPDLMYNQWTYDPSNEETYKVVFAMLDDVIQAVHPRVIHIGHDEVEGVVRRARGSRRELAPGERALPPALFLADVDRLYDYLSARGIKVWMWGDMLATPEEFPRMMARQLHGDAGYASLLPRIPHDIVICDWHYEDDGPSFPTIERILKSGHRALGATWRRDATTRAFARYMGRVDSADGGMIATTWSIVQDGDWQGLQQLLQTSGDAFWNGDRASGGS